MITLDKEKCDPPDLLVAWWDKEFAKQATWQAIRSSSDEMWEITVLIGDRDMEKAIFEQVSKKEEELLAELGWRGK